MPPAFIQQWQWKQSRAGPLFASLLPHQSFSICLDFHLYIRLPLNTFQEHFVFSEELPLLNSHYCDSRSPGQPPDISWPKPQLLEGSTADLGGMTHPDRTSPGAGLQLRRLGDQEKSNRSFTKFPSLTSSIVMHSDAVLQVCEILNMWGENPKPHTETNQALSRSTNYIEKHWVTQIRIIPRRLLSGYCTHDFCHCISFQLVLTNY